MHRWVFGSSHPSVDHASYVSGIDIQMAQRGRAVWGRKHCCADFSVKLCLLENLQQTLSQHGAVKHVEVLLLTSISCPCRRSATAAVRPPIPPPAITTLSLFASAMIMLAVVNLDLWARRLQGFVVVG